MHNHEGPEIPRATMIQRTYADQLAGAATPDYGSQKTPARREVCPPPVEHDQSPVDFVMGVGCDIQGNLHSVISALAERLEAALEPERDRAQLEKPEAVGPRSDSMLFVQILERNRSTSHAIDRIKDLIARLAI